jgi:hypothetical protein
VVNERSDQRPERSDQRVRLWSQRLIGSGFSKPAEVVSWLGGMQGQDLASATWSIGARLPGSVVSDVERAFLDGELVRTWPMRGTLHVVAAEDVRWLLALTSESNVKRSAYRRRQLELDDATLIKSRKALTKALSKRQLTRDELFAVLQRAKISTEGQRGYHLLWDAAVHELICYAAPRGKEQTFALLDDWLPRTTPKPRDEALAELARRYFTSRGPSTAKDFTWWSGLTAREARIGLESCAGELEREGELWWKSSDRAVPAHSALALPGFDEYLLGYQDRSLVLDPRYADQVCPGGNGVFAPTLVLDGQVVGTWIRGTREVRPFKPLKSPQRRAADEALERYAQFIGPKAPRSRRAGSAR